MFVQTQLICCFLDLSRTHLNGSRGITIKIKWKRGKNLNENTIIWEKNSICFKIKIIFSFPFHECTGGSEKQQINWAWPNWLIFRILSWRTSQPCVLIYHYLPTSCALNDEILCVFKSKWKTCSLFFFSKIFTGHILSSTWNSHIVTMITDGSDTSRNCGCDLASTISWKKWVFLSRLCQLSSKKWGFYVEFCRFFNCSNLSTRC